MFHLGESQELYVVKEVGFGIYLGEEENATEKVLLPKKEVPEGIKAGIKRLADDNVRFNLAISLHSAVNTTRDKIMPINKAYPLTELAEAIRYFVDKTGTRPTFEYLLLKGVNDSLDDAKALALFCRQFPVKINIIEYNEVDNAPYRHSPDASRDQFVRYLENKNIVVNIRRSKGKDIDAACGQLANKNS